MSLAGLGRAWELWRLPYHTFVNLREEWLAVHNPPKEKDPDVETRDLGHGVTREERKSSR